MSPGARRSTSNGNVRGNTSDRRRRGEWLVEQFPANVGVIEVTLVDGADVRVHPTDLGHQLSMLESFRRFIGTLYLQVRLLPACRCYRCGALLAADEVSPDRWPIAGVDGGTYKRGNIRPSCLPCNVATGSALGHERKAERRSKKAVPRVGLGRKHQPRQES